MERLLLAQYAVGLLISCERCSTTFQLDDALIPAGGANVQCSRCGLEFWVTRPGEERRTLLICPRCVTRFWLAESAIPPEGTAVQCSRCSEVFRAQRGAPTPGDVVPEQPRRNVMLFGPPPPASAAPPADGRRNNVRNNVMLFGLNALPDPTQPPAESYRSAEGRVIFGAPLPVPTEVTPDRRVMTFGVRPPPAPPPPVAIEPRAPTPAERILDRVANDLDDEHALRVASDALMELDDPRGRLIAFMLDEERQSDLMRKVKVNVLIRDHAEQWAPPGARLTAFRRGLPIEVEWTGATDPQHHVWKSARSINATVDRLPRESVLSVVRPHLTRFDCASRAVFAHAVSVAPTNLQNLEQLDGHIDREQLRGGLVPSLEKLPKLRFVTLRSTTLQFDEALTQTHLVSFFDSVTRLRKLEGVRLSMPRMRPSELAACLARVPSLSVQFVMPWYAPGEKLTTLGIDPRRLLLLLPESVPADAQVYELIDELNLLFAGQVSIVKSR